MRKPNISAEHTAQMIRSLTDSGLEDYEIIVVDNASAEDASYLKEEFPEITLLQLEQNLGFAGGNNKGIALARGNWLLFLNNDVLVEKGFHKPLFECVPSAFITGAL